MIVLSPADYWEIRARSRDVEIFTRDLERLSTSPWAKDGDVIALMQRRFSTAIERREALWGRLRATYDLDEKPYGWDDDQCALIEKTGASGGSDVDAG